MFARALRLQSTTGARHASTFVKEWAAAIQSLPEREAVRYTDKNIKFTATQISDVTDAHANALLEHQFQKGDVLATWLPESAEKHVAILAAAKAGLRIVDIDPSLNSVEEIRTFLKDANAKAIYFNPEKNGVDYMEQLRKAIPEFFHYNDSMGQFFHSKYFPTLKFFIHTGFNNEMGALNFKELFVRDSNTSVLKTAMDAVDDNTPLYSKITKAGKSAEVTQKDAFELPELAFAKKLATNQYFEAA